MFCFGFFFFFFGGGGFGGGGGNLFCGQQVKPGLQGKWTGPKVIYENKCMVMFKYGPYKINVYICMYNDMHVFYRYTMCLQDLVLALRPTLYSSSYL